MSLRKKPQVSDHGLPMACSHCGLYGWVNEQTLICARCGQTHPEPERRALWLRY